LYIIDGDLAFLSKEGESVADNGDSKTFNQAEFQRIKKLKNTMPIKDLCESPEARTLLPFLEEIFSYEFDQAPDYKKLRKMLLHCLKKEGSQPDNIFDWNQEYEMNKHRSNIAQMNLLQVKKDCEMYAEDAGEAQPQITAMDSNGCYQFITKDN
jgi:hypothetical protein